MARAPRKPLPEPTHNSDAADEADRVQLISIVSKLSAAEDEIARAKGPYDAAKAARKKIIGLGKAAGFQAKELEARLAEMMEDSREQEARLEREAKHRKWLGIVRPDQPKLNLDGQTPEEVRDEAYWAAEGYKAGLRRLAATPPDGIPERFVQKWLSERARGAAEVPADHGEVSVAEQARKDFAEDNPDVDLDAEAKRLKESGFTDRGAPEPEDGFEASEEELAQQNARKAVQERREGEDVT